MDGLHIDVKQIDQKTVGEAIDAMVKADPELAWLKDAQKRGDVDWQLIKETHESFKYSNSSLGQGAMLAIIIIVTVLTAGAASAAVGAAASAAAGSGTAMAAAGTATVAGVSSTVAAGFGNVMVSSVLTSMASTAAVSTINNRGNVGAVLKDLTSKDSLKNYAVGAATAGFTSAYLDGTFGVTGDNVNKVTHGFDLSSLEGIGKFAAYSGAQGVFQAGASTLVSGGSLGENLRSALSEQAQGVLRGIAFNAVGDYAKLQNWDDGSLQKIALHALVGGMLSEAAGKGFITGATAAGANEALSNSLSALVKGDPKLQLAASQLVGLTAAGVVGGDLQTGIDIAKDATAYNRQLHPDEIKFASDDERVNRYATEKGITVDQARTELLRTAAAMVDRGWNAAFDEADGKTLDAAGFLRAEVSKSQNTGLFKVSLADYNNERLGLKELFKDRDSVKALVDSIALVDPYQYHHDPKYRAEVLNAKGEGSAEGFAAVMEGFVSSGSKSALWVMGAASCPSCAIGDMEAALNSVKSRPEEFQLKGYLDTLHTMQGNGADVVRANEAAATAAGIGIGLAIDGGLSSVGGKGIEDVAGRPKGPAETPATKGPCCFAAGTKVSTPQGDRVIESLKVGDVVWSKPEKGGKPFAAAILATHQRSDQPIYRLKLKNVSGAGTAEGETLLVTPSHPFYVPAKRDFIPVIDLKPGDLLQSLADGDTENTSSEVESLELYLPEGKTYNLTVDVGHTFYVGKLKTWVHNTGPCDLPPDYFAGGPKGSSDVPATSPIARDGLRDDLFAVQAKDPRIGTVLPGAKAPVTVTAESSIGGRTLLDTNQTARPVDLANPNKPTLIADLIPPGKPNSTMANAHAEIGLIQQAFDSGLTRGQTMTIVVRGEEVCSFCKSNLTAAADRAGLNSLQVVDTVKGRVYEWVRGSGWKE